MTMNTCDSPWPCAIHNPDNLEPSQFGDPTIWRPATPDEYTDVYHEVWDKGIWHEAVQNRSQFKCWIATYRIRLADRPWPVAKPAEFPAPPVGHEWHNPDGVKASDVPTGWRLAVKAEIDNSKRHHAKYWAPSYKQFQFNYYIFDGQGSNMNRTNTLILPASTPFPPADLKLRKIGVLLPITDPLPPVPEGCVRVAGFYHGSGWTLGEVSMIQDTHYADLIIPPAPDKRAKFEAMWKKGAAAQLDWNREEDGQFTCELIERAFQHWLNAGGDK